MTDSPTAVPPVAPQPVLAAIEEALLQGAGSHEHRARNIARCIADAGYDITPNPLGWSGPRPVVLEVLERVNGTPDEIGVLPNEVHLNGMPLLTAEGQSVRVHELSTSSADFVTATITLVCRRVLIEQRGPVAR